MSDTINVYLLETVENLKWNHICSMQKYVSVQRQKRINAYRFERDKISSLVTALKKYEFSISHSDRQSVFTDYKSSVGIDIEMFSNNIKEYKSIYENNFTINERQSKVRLPFFSALLLFIRILFVTAHSIC